MLYFNKMLSFENTTAVKVAEVVALYTNVLQTHIILSVTFK